MTLETPSLANVGVELTAEQEELAIKRFADFFKVLTEESVRHKVGSVYAADSYLNDTLKEVRGLEAIKEYFLESARAVESCTVSIQDQARSGCNYYVRWEMEIQFKKLRRGEVTRSCGMSHLVFDADGKIVYHQDYWDSAGGLFQYIPLLGTAIQFIKKRL